MVKFNFSSLKKDENQVITPVISNASKSLIHKREKKQKNKDEIVNAIDEFTVSHTEFIKTRKEGVKILNEYNEISKTENIKGKFYKELAMKFQLGSDYNRDELRFLVRYLQVECLPYAIRVKMYANSGKQLTETLKLLEELKSKNLFDKIF